MRAQLTGSQEGLAQLEGKGGTAVVEVRRCLDDATLEATGEGGEVVSKVRSLLPAVQLDEDREGRMANDR